MRDRTMRGSRWRRRQSIRKRVAGYEYERAGGAAVFMFCEPLSGRRGRVAPSWTGL